MVGFQVPPGRSSLERFLCEQEFCVAKDNVSSLLCMLVKCQFPRFQRDGRYGKLSCNVECDLILQDQIDKLMRKKQPTQGQYHDGREYLRKSGNSQQQIARHPMQFSYQYSDGHCISCSFCLFFDKGYVQHQSHCALR